MKKVIALIMVVLLLIVCSSCKAEDETQNVITTTQVSTTVSETTTNAGISESEAIALAEDELLDLVDEEFLDEYDLFVSTNSYELTPTFANYDSATEKWKVEIMGTCFAKDWSTGTGRSLGQYVFMLDIYVTKDGKIDGVNFHSLAKM